MQSMHLPLSDYYDGISEAANPEDNDWYGYTLLGLSFLLKGEPDSDRDGIADQMDDCPQTPGLKIFAGCPDTDLDGVRDKDDRCPQTPGLFNLRGCPDTDLDGVADLDDECPQVAGLPSLKGNPDTDQDGMADQLDECPLEKGMTALKGCPDSDGDKITDKNDRCPTQAGVPALFGCPDSDGDGIADAEDKCPTQAGEANLGGCPALALPVVSSEKTCAASSDPIFNNLCVNPKKLSRLGTNPEFGNSHALSPTGFYEKLVKAYNTNPRWTRNFSTASTGQWATPVLLRQGQRNFQT